MSTNVVRIDKPPVITPAIRRRAYVRLFATLIYSEDAHKREAARAAIKLVFKLRQDCQERKSA